LAHGGSREHTLTNKNNPNPDLSDASFDCISTNNRHQSSSLTSRDHDGAGPVDSDSDSDIYDELINSNGEHLNDSDKTQISDTRDEVSDDSNDDEEINVT